MIVELKYLNVNDENALLIESFIKQKPNINMILKWNCGENITVGTLSIFLEAISFINKTKIMGNTEVITEMIKFLNSNNKVFILQGNEVIKKDYLYFNKTNKTKNEYKDNKSKNNNETSSFNDDNEICSFDDDEISF